MADVNHHEAPTHPVAPRVQGKDGRPVPHVGPTIQHYYDHHKTTVGQGSDEFWRKVCLRSVPSPPL